MPDHYPNPVSPGGSREYLSVTEFQRTMDMRSQMLEAQFSELRTLIESGFDGVHARQDELGQKQDRTNGRIAHIDTHGCAARPCQDSSWTRKQIVIAGSGGVGVGAALLELFKLVGNALGGK